MQQIRQHVLVRYRSRRRAHRMHMALLGVHSDVRLQPEVPLLSLARLMHFRVALSAPVLGRRGRMNNGRIHNRAGGDADAPAFQILVHRVQHRPAQFVLLQQVTKPKNGALVRHRRTPQIDAHKVPQHRRFIQRILRPRIAQVEPLLQKIHPQHDAQSYRRPPVLSLRIVWFHQPL